MPIRHCQCGQADGWRFATIAEVRPVRELPGVVARDLIGVFADIDDTITTDGRLTADAYVAMARVQDAGLLMIPITGRPAGWCDHIARMWPVDGVVGENGAFYFRYDRQRKKFISRLSVSAEHIQQNRTRLDQIARRILVDVPGCAMASDQAYRMADIAIDFCEDVAPLSIDAVDEIVRIMTSEGLTAKVSSIHVNGWFGSHDKLSMTRQMMVETFSINIDQAKEKFVFVGDSPNDQPMFKFFPHAVGVANLRKFIGRLDVLPTYVTDAAGGTGFAEVVDTLISARSDFTV